MTQPRLAFVCSKHNCRLRGEPKFSRETRHLSAKEQVLLKLREDDNERPTRYHLIDLIDVYCGLDGYDTCNAMWEVSLHMTF